MKKLALLIALAAYCSFGETKNVAFDTATNTVVKPSDQLLLPQNKYDATGAPDGTTDDVTLGYFPGSFWHDLTNAASYVCLDNTAGAAVWTNITSAGAMNWADAVDADIIPSGDGLWDLGSNAVRFGEAYTDALDVIGAIVVGGTVDGRDVATDGTKLDGIEAAADVTDTTNVTAAGALMDSEVDADIQTLALPASVTISAFGASLIDDADASAILATLSLDADLATFAAPASTTISAFGATVVDDTDAATARTTLGVDAAGTDNSTDVTLAGTPDYLTLAGQVLTRGLVDVTTDITGVLPDANVADNLTITAGTITNGTMSNMDHILKLNTTPIHTGEGDIEWDSDDDQLAIGNGTVTLLFSADSALDTEAELEARLTDVTDVFTDNDVIPIANLATGTPDGTKFVRDDGTLAVPAGGAGDAWGDPVDANITLDTDGVYSIGTNDFRVKKIWLDDIQVGASGIEGTQIRDGTITANDIAFNAVGSNQIADDSVGISELGIGAPGQDVLIGWDAAPFSGVVAFTLGTNLSITGTTINAASAGTGEIGADELASTAVTAATYQTWAGSLTVDADGRLTDVTNLGKWTSLLIPAGSFTAPTTNGAELVKEEGTNTIRSAYKFDAVTDESVQISFPWPRDYGGGTVKGILHWYGDTGASTGNTCIWEVSVGSYGNDEDSDGALGTLQSVTDTVLSALDDNHIATTPAITASGTPAAGELCTVKVLRNGGTMSADGVLIAFELAYQKLTTAPAAP